MLDLRGQRPARGPARAALARRRRRERIERVQAGKPGLHAKQVRNHDGRRPALIGHDVRPAPGRDETVQHLEAARIGVGVINADGVVGRLERRSDGVEALPSKLIDLLDRSESLYRRIARFDDILFRNAEAAPGVQEHFAILQAAFAQGNAD